MLSTGNTASGLASAQGYKDLEIAVKHPDVQLMDAISESNLQLVEKVRLSTHVTLRYLTLPLVTQLVKKVRLSQPAQYGLPIDCRLAPEWTLDDL